VVKTTNRTEIFKSSRISPTSINVRWKYKTPVSNTFCYILTSGCCNSHTYWCYTCDKGVICFNICPDLLCDLMPDDSLFKPELLWQVLEPVSRRMNPLALCIHCYPPPPDPLLYTMKNMCLYTHNWHVNS
jgi:hypothetical protein